MEAYVDVLEINSWCESTLDPHQTRFLENENKWEVTIVKKSTEGVLTRKMKVGHIVLATGLGGGKPKMPAEFPGQAGFGGKVVHSSRHGSGADWKGKKALVVGACTSGHDVSGVGGVECGWERGGREADSRSAWLCVDLG